MYCGDFLSFFFDWGLGFGFDFDLERGCDVMDWIGLVWGVWFGLVLVGGQSG